MTFKQIKTYQEIREYIPDYIFRGDTWYPVCSFRCFDTGEVLHIVPSDVVSGIVVRRHPLGAYNTLFDPFNGNILYWSTTLYGPGKTEKINLGIHIDAIKEKILNLPPLDSLPVEGINDEYLAKYIARFSYQWGIDFSANDFKVTRTQTYVHCVIPEFIIDKLREFIRFYLIDNKVDFSKSGWTMLHLHVNSLAGKTGDDYWVSYGDYYPDNPDDILLASHSLDLNKNGDLEARLPILESSNKKT